MEHFKVRTPPDESRVRTARDSGDTLLWLLFQWMCFSEPECQMKGMRFKKRVSFRVSGKLFCVSALRRAKRSLRKEFWL